MTPPPAPVLLGDIGGTNARFAVLTAGTIGEVMSLRVADFATLGEAAQAFLRSNGARPRCAVLAVAGPVEQGCCQLTNSPWHVDARELACRLGFETADLVNDFVATAWSLPRLPAEALSSLGGAQPDPAAPAVVMGPGTGFGAACLIQGRRGPTVVPSEAGHAGMPAADEREDRIIAHLRRRFGRVSVERLLSGPGLENIEAAIQALAGGEVTRRSAPAITAAAADRSSPSCRDAVDLFCAMLGSVAGDLALAFGARGGVYIAGGIAPRLLDSLRASAFRRRFEAKGRLSGFVRSIPTQVICRADAPLLGLAAMLAVGEGSP